MIKVDIYKKKENIYGYRMYFLKEHRKIHSIY
jgi:hypothetical protein